ncbi:MAG: hypothetical protein ACOX5R_22520 [bacterium]
MVWNGEIPEREQLRQVRWIEGSGREESYFSEEFSAEVLEQFQVYKPKDLQGRDAEFRGNFRGNRTLTQEWMRYRS